MDAPTIEVLLELFHPYGVGGEGDEVVPREADDAVFVAITLRKRLRMRERELTISRANVER